MAGLKDCREIFCQELSKGATQRQAYYAAYPQSRAWKESTVDPRACRLARDPEVAARLTELRKQAAKANAITRDDLIAQLAKVGFAPTTGKVAPRDKVRAIEAIAKLLGFDQIQSDSGERIEDLTVIAELLAGSCGEAREKDGET